jgi:DNA-binding XRE family transcriptional regulator
MDSRRNAVEDSGDIQEIRDSINNPSETFPLSVVSSLSKGGHPIKVYREYREISQTALAKKVNVSKQYISQIETGKRKGSAKVLKSIAKELKVDTDDLMMVGK